jgi:Bifunctional DNA primase/polymerase, N-terminal
MSKQAVKAKKKDEKTKPTQNTSARLAMALRYAENGLPVMPLHGMKDGECTCGKKDCALPAMHPRPDGGIADATTDPETIRKYWTKWPKAKIAVATGAPDVVAVAVYKQTPSPWSKFECDHGPPNTVHFEDLHCCFYLFRAAPPEGQVQVAEGVTVLGKGSYVVVPSNFETSRTELAFEKGQAVGEVQLADLPGWLTDLICLQGGSTGYRLWPFDTLQVFFDWIIVPAGPPCDPEKVDLLAESFEITGIRRPLVVRQLENSPTGFRGWGAPRLELLSDPHQFEAMKKRGLDGSECVVMQCDETDGKLWQLGEILNQPDLLPLDWAEAIMEWVRLVNEKGARLGHPAGGVQPHDKGFSRAGRVLGVSRSQVQRAEKMVRISAEAKAEIRRIGVKEKQDLLKIARLPADEQVAAVQELEGPKPRVTRANATAPSKGPQPAIASERKPAAPPEDEPAGAEDEAENQEDAAVESPSTAPGDNSDGIDIPSLPRRDNAAETLESLISNWEAHCQRFYDDLPDALCRQFISERLRYIVTHATTRLRGRQDHGEANGPNAEDED